MQDHELVERPGKGWTPWQEGAGEIPIDKVWWAARVLHFAKLNVSCWFDGSEVVGIWHWGYRREKWCMKLKPADWQPLPEVYRRAREAEKQRELDLFRQRVEKRCLEATARRQETHGADTVLSSGQGLRCATGGIHDRLDRSSRQAEVGG